jgi:hypothetical protein
MQDATPDFQPECRLKIAQHEKNARLERDRDVTRLESQDLALAGGGLLIYPLG